MLRVFRWNPHDQTGPKSNPENPKSRTWEPVIETSAILLLLLLIHHHQQPTPPPPRRPLPLITTSTTHVSHNSQERTHEAEAFSGSWASSAWFGATYRSSSPALGSPTLCFEVWADLCFMVLVSRGSCLSAKQSTAPDPFSQLGCSREAHEHRCVDRHRCACQGLIAIRPLVN